MEGKSLTGLGGKIGEDKGEGREGTEREGGEMKGGRGGEGGGRRGGRGGGGAQLKTKQPNALTMPLNYTNTAATTHTHTYSNYCPCSP